MLLVHAHWSAPEKVLTRAEVLKSAAETDSQSSVAKWLADLDCHMDYVTGCASGSRDNYPRYARQLLQDVFGDSEV